MNKFLEGALTVDEYADAQKLSKKNKGQKRRQAAALNKTAAPSGSTNKRLQEFFDPSQIQKEEEKKVEKMRKTLGAPLMDLNDILAELDEPLSQKQQDDLQAKHEAAEERKSK